MARTNTPVDHMFRAGQISSKEWKRLSGKQPGKFKSQHGRMANFDAKERDEGGVRGRAVSSSTSRHINGPDQGKGTPALAGGRPSKGGRVNAYGQPGVGALNDANMQKPNFPAGGAAKSGNARKTLSHQQPSSSQPGGPQYGGPSRRPEAPARLR